MEAEPIFMVLASKEAVYLSNVIAGLGFGKPFKPATLRRQHRRSTHCGQQHVQLTHLGGVLIEMFGRSTGRQ